MTKTLSELLSEFAKLKKHDDRINFLRNHNSLSLATLLQCTFHPNIKFIEGIIPEFKPSEVPGGMGYANLHTELIRTYLFIKDNPMSPATLSNARRKEILVQILENLEAPEANLYLGMMNKNLKIRGLTHKVVKEAFPSLLP